MSEASNFGTISLTNKSVLYERYHISTKEAEDAIAWPSRFKVQVKRLGLAKLIVKELFHYGPKKDVLLSRPCVYGVFSGPVGGFLPIEKHCVGCLRCTTEFPEFVRVEHNPERKKLGDSFFTFRYVDTASYEASSGLIPVKGAGYRGKFGGEDWDGMWTDMSEIVRPTRDGIHGREFISTVVDIGYKPNFLVFNDQGESEGAQAKSLQLPLPILYDVMPKSVLNIERARMALLAAANVGSLAIVPFEFAHTFSEFANSLALLVSAQNIGALKSLTYTPAMIEMDGWNEELFGEITKIFPESVLTLRTDFNNPKLLAYVEKGISVFHLTNNYHGRSSSGQFVLGSIREAHLRFVEAGIRQEISIIGSGGIIAAEHVPKALICGLDAVALDTPLMVALQADFDGDCIDWDTSKFSLSSKIEDNWAVQRMMNLTASWRDQLLEILGAMGIREVRRLRGEMGRAMFMKTLELEAFAGIEGYDG